MSLRNVSRRDLSHDELWFSGAGTGFERVGDTSKKGGRVALAPRQLRTSTGEFYPLHPCRTQRVPVIIVGSVVRKKLFRCLLSSLRELLYVFPGMSIRILSPELQQRIAAGEVIERPASAVKELIENALDAGAMTIRVDIQEGGRRLIRVTDDGSGISTADMRLACERFATSKITREDDLRAVRTFGFRGEALPSIASVSRLRVLSRERNALLGTEARLEGGKLLSFQEAGAAIGTTVEVWDLFYNTPARRQFLRSLRTEYGHILGVFTRFALAFPERRFSLFFDGRELYAFEPGLLSERISSCFGREATSSLEEFDSTGIIGRAGDLFSRQRRYGGGGIISSSTTALYAIAPYIVLFVTRCQEKAAWFFFFLILLLHLLT